MMRIFNRVSKHLDKSGFDELVEFGKLLFAKQDKIIDTIQRINNFILNI